MNNRDPKNCSKTQEPVAWRYTDSRGKYRYIGHNPEARDMLKDYAILDPVPLYLHHPENEWADEIEKEAKDE